MSVLPTGTVTFLFTDLEGSTQLWDAYPDAMRADLARHDSLLRAAIAVGGGHVFKTVGDAFCAAFATALQGLAAALTAQRSLGAEAWTVPGVGLRARMGLHTGEAQERDGDYFGPALNRAARLRDIAHGGQTVLSQATEQMVRDSLPAGASLRDLGPHRLRDLSRPEQVFQVLHPDLPDDFAALRSLDRFPHNLPQRLDSFVGRAAELAEAKRLLSSSRLVTLTGAGGAGKTRLAQQAGAEALERFPDGVWFVGLEALADPALVPQAVAVAVGAREQPGQSLTETLCETMRDQRLLLLLDNCEHMIGACAHLSQTLLQACPHVQILATSREPLGISGEAALPVPTLPQTAPSGANLGAGPDAPSDAVRLFVERATLKHPSFALTAQNAPAVARICRRLDGIPLAIELAAPRVRMLTPEQIAQRLDKDFRLLTGGSRTALPRQQTMQAAIDWSHALLSEPERGLFRRLSVFAGGWTLEAAERVCSGDGLGEWDVMELLSSLVAKSLVQADEDEGGECRYRMLETLRQYGGEQLEASPDFDAVHDQHLGWFLGLAEQAEPELRGPQQAEWLDRLEAEHDNFRAALTWAVPEARLRLGTLLHRFWYTRGHLTEGRSWLEGAIRDAADVTPHVLAQALNAAGVLAWFQADNGAAFSSQEQALSLSREAQDQAGVARTLINLGILCDERRDYAGAQRHYQEGLSLYRESGDADNVARTLINLASNFIQTGDPASARSCLQESLPLLQTAKDRWPLAIVYYNFGLLALNQGDALAVRDWFERSLAVRKALGDALGIASCLLPLARALFAQRKFQGAVTLLGAADAVYARLQTSRQDSTAQEAAALASALSGRVTPEAYAAAWEQGGALSATAAADYALLALKDEDGQNGDGQNGDHTS